MNIFTSRKKKNQFPKMIIQDMLIMIYLFT